MERLKGRALSVGDTIGIVAPSSPVREWEVLIKGKARLEERGYKVKLGASCYETYGGYLAGRATRRAADIHDMFESPEIDAIICLRGGYGAMQLLPLLNYNIIREHPKLFIGYSDVTALHIVLGQQAGLATVHGPMLASDFTSELNDFSLSHLLRLIQGDENAPIELCNPPGGVIACLVPGVAQGQLVGGNLSLIASTIGTPYEIDTKGKVLFLEEIGEEPYRIDRLLMQLQLAGKLEDAAGFVFGQWTDCEAKQYADGFTVIHLLEKIIIPYKKPAIYNVQAGHCTPTLTLPLGVDVTVDATQKKLIVEESVVARVH